MSRTTHLATGSAFAHEGDFILQGKAVYWREKAGGEIVFRFDRKSPYLVLDRMLDEIAPKDAAGRELVKINTVNKILAHYRPHAMPDENGYYAASGMVVRPNPEEAGTLYVSTNNERQIKDPYTGRGCAETGALGKCQKAMDDPQVPIAEVYLMSGRAKKMRDGSFTDTEPGHVSCLCGECRQNVREHTEHAVFYMLPSNDGSLELTINDGPQCPTSGDQAWRITPKMLYPLPYYRPLDASYTPFIMAGYDYITDPSAPSLRLKTWIDDVPMDAQGMKQFTLEQQKKLIDEYSIPSMREKPLEEHPTLENMNRTMLGLMKEAYNVHGGARGQKHFEITTVLVQTKSGRIAASVLVNGELWLPSKPNVYVGALTNVLNLRDVEHVYTMTFDKDVMRREQIASDAHEEVRHAVKMPDPAALGRILKNAQGIEPTLLALPLNDGSLHEEPLRAMADPAINVRKDFGPDFCHPKRDKEALLGM